MARRHLDPSIWPNLGEISSRWNQSLPIQCPMSVHRTSKLKLKRYGWTYVQLVCGPPSRSTSRETMRQSSAQVGSWKSDLELTSQPSYQCFSYELGKKYFFGPSTRLWLAIASTCCIVHYSHIYVKQFYIYGWFIETKKKVWSADKQQLLLVYSPSSHLSMPAQG